MKCGHQQSPDSTIMEPWLLDVPCPWPECTAGTPNRTFHAIDKTGTEIVYRREQSVTFVDRYAGPSQFRWVLDR